MKQKKIFAKHSGQAQILLIAAVLFIGFLLTGGVISQQSSSILPKPGFNTNNTPNETNTNESKQSLQLKTLGFNTPTPTPTIKLVPINTPIPQVCAADNGQLIAPLGTSPDQISCSCHGIQFGWIISCQGGHGTCIDSPKAETSCTEAAAQQQNYLTNPLYQQVRQQYGPNFLDALCGVAGRSGDGIYCLDKPVIYLYPIKDTIVDVAVKTPGKIVISDPPYPERGWKNILAHPNGSLEFKNKQYHELFYESSVSTFKKPTQGITIATNELTPRLSDIISKLGLNKTEGEEFVDYWVPRLKRLSAPYIFFSIIDSKTKESIDHIEVDPKPDTRIEFLAYFKPIEKPLPDSLELPSTPLQRTGFTEVEWGGTIDTN